MIRPTPAAVLLGLASGAVLLIPLAGGPQWSRAQGVSLWVTTMAALAIVMILDLLLLPLRDSVRVSAVAPELLYIGRTGADLDITIISQRNCRCQVLASLPPLLDPCRPVSLQLEKGRPGTVIVPLKPLARGTGIIGAVWLRMHSPMRLFTNDLRFTTEVSLKIAPDIQSVRERAAFQFNQKSWHTGRQMEKYAGDGSEFQSLRDFAPGMDSRSIDWKATARARKLTSREYRAERNHQIMIGIDCGRLMREAVLGVPKVDHAVNSGLHLAFTSLNTGDRVGFFSFAERLIQFHRPDGGSRAFTQIQKASAAVAYRQTETNFALSLAEAGERLHRRSLIVLLSDFEDTTTAAIMTGRIGALARRHLVLFVTLRDPSIQAVAEREPANLHGIHAANVARAFERDRTTVLQKLAREGVLCLDSEPAHVSARLLNQYLEIKRRELIG